VRFIDGLQLLHTKVQYRGRVIRSLQNRAAYKHRHGRQGTDTTKILLTRPSAQEVLDPALVTLALMPLPDTYLFHEALCGEDALDESELGVWDAKPPYPLSSTPEDSTAEREFTRRLVEVMHGRRLRMQEENEKKRDKLYGHVPSELKMGIYEDFVAGLRGCERTELFIKCFSSARASQAFQITEHFLQWQARTVYMLYEKYTCMETDI
jgi:hypothetical protein